MSQAHGPSPHRPDTGAAAPPASPVPTPSRSFRPGPGFAVALVVAALIVVLALSAAITTALGARGASSVLGGSALILVGLSLLAVLRVPARSLVVNAPRLRLERNRARAVLARREREAQTVGRWWAKRRGSRPRATGATGAGPAGHEGRPLSPGAPEAPATAGTAGTDLAPLTVPGTGLTIPESTGRRELTTIDVVSGPLTSALATTRIGQAADEHLAGTTTGESLVRVGQLLLGAFGFVLVALGLASILGQVIA